MGWEPRWDDCDDEVAVHTDGRRLGSTEAAKELNRLEATVAALVDLSVRRDGRWWVACWVRRPGSDLDVALSYHETRERAEAAVFAAAGLPVQEDKPCGK